jgi:hypothetical protein
MNALGCSLLAMTAGCLPDKALKEASWYSAIHIDIYFSSH